MKINFEYHDVSSSQDLQNFTQEKVSNILERTDAATGVDVYFKTNDAKLPEDRMVAGIRLEMPGETLFAESVSDSFHQSVSEASKEVMTQLQRYKEKQRSY